jgi:hypothetical protein
VSFKYYLIVLGCTLLTKLCSVEVFGPQGINRFTTEILVQDNNLLGTNDVVRNLETDVACYKLQLTFIFCTRKYIVTRQDCNNGKIQDGSILVSTLLLCFKIILMFILQTSCERT